MSYLNPLDIQKPQDLHLSDEERHTQFKNAGLDGNYSSMTGLIYNGNNVRTEVAGKVNIKELYNEIDGQIHQLEDYNQSGVNDELEEHAEDFQDTIDNISDKGAYSPSTVYHFGNVVDYSRMNSKITPKYNNQQNTTTGKNLYEGSQDWSGTWANDSEWLTDTQTYNGLVVKKKSSAWAGLYKEINVEAGKTYTFSCYVKSESDRQVSLYLSNGTATVSIGYYNFRPLTTWARYSLRFSVTTSGTIKPRVENNQNIDGSYTYICGYQLEESTTMTDYEPYTGGIPSPNPDYPQDITTIKPINLFDTELEQNARNNADGNTILWSENYIRTKNKISVKPNTTYYLSYKSSVSFQGGDIQQYRENEEYISNVSLGTAPKTYTTPNDCYYINIQWYRTTGIVPSDITNIQLEEGDTSHIYAPHGKIPLRCYTNNLATVSEYTLPSDQTESTKWAATSSDYISVKYGDTYTLSFYYNNILNYSNTNGYAYVYAYNSSKQQIGNDYINTAYMTPTRTISDANIAYLKVLMGVKGLKGDNFKVQLEEGSTRTEYKPYYNKYFYLDMQGNELSKITAGAPSSPKTVEDDITIDENNNIIFNKKVGKCVLIGTESISSDSASHRFVTAITNSITETARNRILCDRFRYVSSGNTTDGGCFVYGGAAYFYNFSCTSLQDFKTWLSTHNTTFYYELQTPQEISLGTLPADFLPHLGNVNVELCTNLENVNKYSMTTNSYLTLQDTTAGTLPTNTTYFKNIGLTGDIGDSSMGTVTCGVWDSTSTYNEKDLVAYGTDLYVAKQANTNQTPSSASQYWELIIQYDKPLVALSNYAPDNIIKGSLWFDII